MATIPVISCECERSISLLGWIKTSLRSTMGQDRLNGLAMLHCHQNNETYARRGCTGVCTSASTTRETVEIEDGRDNYYQTIK